MISYVLQMFMKEIDDSNGDSTLEWNNEVFGVKLVQNGLGNV